MTQELKITKDKAQKAHLSADTNGKKLLEDLFGERTFLSITDRIKTFEDVCAELGEDPNDYLINDVMSARRKGQIYSEKYMLIIEVFQEGWIPNWANSNEGKYYPWMQYSPASGFSYIDYFYVLTFTTLGSRLVVPSKELAIYIGNQFEKEINDFFTIK